MVAEVLRCGAYADEVVMNFVNRRFVPHWFDVAKPEINAGDGWAYEADAVAAIGRLDKNPKGKSRGGGFQSKEGRVTASNYPAAIFLTPDGKRLQDVELWGILPPERFVEALKRVAAQYPDYFSPTAEENATFAHALANPDNALSQADAARVAFEILEWEKALAFIATALERSQKCSATTRADLLFLRAKIRFYEKDNAAAVDDLRFADQANGGDNRKLAAEIAVLSGKIAMHAKRYDDAIRIFRKVVDDAREIALPAAGEARYRWGLALWKAEKTEEAKDVWRRHKKEMPWDRYARRSAASIGLPESEAFTNQEIFEDSGWW